MAPIRVLRIIDRLNVGGPALQATVLSRGLDPARFEQRLITGSIDPGEAEYAELRAPDLPLERVPGLGRTLSPRDDARAFVRLVSIIREFRPTIVHTHKAKAGVLGRAAAWGTRVPITVHSFHGHLLHGYFSPARTRAIAAVERTMASNTTALVAVGCRVRDDLLGARIGRLAQYTVVPPGVALPPPPSRSDARRALALAPDVPVIVFVGRLTRIKRPDRLVDVALWVAREHPDAMFVVAGEGELLEATRERARPLGDRFRFVGWRGDVEVLYAAADVVLLTSDNEGMPVSLIEAALSGAPAVTTRVGSAPEVVEDGVTGIVTTSSVPALSAAVSSLVADDKTRSLMGSAARARAQRLFGADRLVTDMSGLYEQVVREHAGLG